MAEKGIKRGIPRYAIIAVVFLVGCVVAAGATLFERAQSDLRMLGGQIASIKDADLTSTNHFISAYAQIEPVEKEYELKLQQFT